MNNLYCSQLYTVLYAPIRKKNMNIQRRKWNLIGFLKRFTSLPAIRRISPPLTVESLFFLVNVFFLCLFSTSCNLRIFNILYTHILIKTSKWTQFLHLDTIWCYILLTNPKSILRLGFRFGDLSSPQSANISLSNLSLIHI